MKFLVEPYTPFAKYGRLMINKNVINPFVLTLMIMTVALLIGGLFDVYALSLLVFPIIGTVWYVYESTRGFYLIAKKRGPYTHAGSYNLFKWYRADLLDEESIYKEKLVEYLDFIRAGGKNNATVEEHLEQWAKELDTDIEAREKEHEANDAALFVNTEQLEAYRRVRRDVSDLRKV